jgi:hypothetical protein
MTSETREEDFTGKGGTPALAHLLLGRGLRTWDDSGDIGVHARLGSRPVGSLLLALGPTLILVFAPLFPRLLFLTLADRRSATVHGVLPGAGAGPESSQGVETALVSGPAQ